MGRLVDLRLAGLWQERLARFAAGRLGMSAFCRREGVSQAAFYQWRRKLEVADGPLIRATTGSGSALKVPAVQQVVKTPAFQEVELFASPPRGSVTIRMPGGAVFGIESDRGLVEVLFLAVLTSQPAGVAGVATRC